MTIEQIAPLLFSATLTLATGIILKRIEAITKQTADTRSADAQERRQLIHMLDAIGNMSREIAKIIERDMPTANGDLQRAIDEYDAKRRDYTAMVIHMAADHAAER